MVVIFHEDHSLPIVTVNIGYKVGSRYEEPHRSGFAHLFEHLMFMGTEQVPTKMFDAWMEAAGGWNNAWTSEDRTDYYDVAPPNALPLLLWLEADRMRNVGRFMTAEKLEAQRAVVRNERRQSIENVPYGIVELRLPELMYAAEHPYHHPVIGSHEDLEAATVDDVKRFFSTWYDPANASLVVAGDFNRADTEAKIRSLFGTIPSNGVPKDPGAPQFSDQKTTLTQTVRDTLHDKVELPKLVIAWQSPKLFGSGDAELDLLADVLADGKASRLYRALVVDQKIAQEVEANQENGMLGSRFVVSAIARPGVPLAKIEAAIDAEIDRVREKDVTSDEMARARNGYETAFFRRIESVRECAQLLNIYEMDLGDPGYLARDLARYTAVTPSSMRDVAKRVLDKNARVILQVLPVVEGAVR